MKQHERIQARLGQWAQRIGTGVRKLTALRAPGKCRVGQLMAMGAVLVMISMQAWVHVGEKGARGSGRKHLVRRSSESKKGCRLRTRVKRLLPNNVQLHAQIGRQGAQVPGRYRYRAVSPRGDTAHTPECGTAAGLTLGSCLGILNSTTSSAESDRLRVSTVFGGHDYRKTVLV